jgi:universal stress protein E
MTAKKLLVVFDPTRDEQPALDRASAIAGDREVSVHLFASIYGDIDPALNQSDEIAARVEAQKERLKNASAQLTDVHVEVEWSPDWYKSVVRATKRKPPDAVLKSSFVHSDRQRRKCRSSDWTLVRECECPVLLVKLDGGSNKRVVLAGVDMQSPKKSYQALNQRIVSFCRELLDVDSAEVHFVNAFRDARLAPDREALMAATGVDADHVHLHMGDSGEVILQKAKSLDANLVVLGHSSRTGLSAALAGNTVERVLDKLECDLLSIPVPAQD